MKKDKVCRLYASVGHFLVLCAGLIILLMPWTEQHWTFDGFLHGRPDFELSLLAVVTMLCLVLLLAFMAKHSVAVLLSLRIWFSRMFNKAGLLAQLSFCGLRSESVGAPGPYPAMGFYNLPLQI